MNDFKFKKDCRPLEKDIEAYHVRQVKTKLGGMSEKFTSPNKRSVPDRIDVLPCSILNFVELKRPGEKPTHLQAKDHAKRRALGHRVYVIDTKEGVDAYIKEMQEEIELLSLL